MTDNENKYWAFLSYSHQDNREQRPDTPAVSNLRWGNWLLGALKTFSVPTEFAGQINGRGEIIPERIDPVFQDEPELPDNADLSAETRQALEQSICLVVVCSPRSAKSLRVNETVRYFKQLGRGKHILPIVVAGEPNVSDGSKPGLSAEDECFVPALRHPVLPDGTVDTIKRATKYIFVDARHGVDKREILVQDNRTAEADLEMAKIQLIALLLGVGFNGLWWREQKRHFYDLAEAHHQIREARNQVEEARRQLQEAQQQTHEAQNKALELQNLPRDIHSQIQEAQNQSLESQKQAREAQKQLQDFQNKVRDTQTQLEEARQRALTAESKVLEAQNQARETGKQLEETRNQTREAQKKALETQSLPPAVPERMQGAQSQILEAQQEAQKVRSQLVESRNQIQKIQKQSRNARRLTKIFAIIAVLSLLAASQALRQRQIAGQALAKTAAEGAWKYNRASGRLNQHQIRQALQNIGGTEQERSLCQLAAGIPREEIPEALKASSVILNDQQRSHFQKWLLVRLGWANPLSAMTSANAMEGKIVNDEGLSDSGSYFQLAVLDNWMKTNLPEALSWVLQLPDSYSRQRALEKIIPALGADNPQSPLAWLNDLESASNERIYQLMFQRRDAATNWIESLNLP
ncbi:MAG: hypothetical protein WCH99_09105 [Verrucomicrobiota bacterium]